VGCQTCPAGGIGRNLETRDRRGRAGRSPDPTRAKVKPAGGSGVLETFIGGVSAGPKPRSVRKARPHSRLFEAVSAPHL